MHVPCILGSSRTRIDLALQTSADCYRKWDRLEHLVKAHELAPAHADYLVGLATICRDNQKIEDARVFARKLVDLEPENEGYRRLLFEIINTKP